MFNREDDKQTWYRVVVSVRKDYPDKVKAVKLKNAIIELGDMIAMDLSKSSLWQRMRYKAMCQRLKSFGYHHYELFTTYDFDESEI